MREPSSPGSCAPDVRKTITVAVPVRRAFTVFVEQPGQWLPPEHAFVAGDSLVVMEPEIGGRFYERGTDGSEVVRGVILGWDPPHRVTMTWRVGAGWRPVFDDEHASRITVEFSALDAGETEVAVSYSELWRHGDMAAQVRAALAAPGPGATLTRYAAALARHTPDS